MKKIMSLILIVICFVVSLEYPINASASVRCIPSGIDYDAIGEAVQSF